MARRARASAGRIVRPVAPLVCAWRGGSDRGRLRVLLKQIAVIAARGERSHLARAREAGTCPLGRALQARYTGGDYGQGELVAQRLEAHALQVVIPIAGAGRGRQSVGRGA